MGRRTSFEDHLDDGESSKPYRQFITFAICVMIVGQVAAIIVRSGPAIWPFTNYDMYASAHYENERIPAYHSIYAQFEDGSEKLITWEDIGVYWFYESWARTMIGLEDDSFELGGVVPQIKSEIGTFRGWVKQYFSRRTSIDRYIDVFTATIEERINKVVVKYRIEDFPAIITSDGYVDAPPSLVVKELTITRSESQ